MTLYKLKKTDEFSSVFSFRKRFYGEWLFANIKPNQLSHHRYGLVVSKKVSKLAVRRNYMKRVLREVLRAHPAMAPVCFDVVVQVRKPFKQGEFAQVRQDVETLLRRLSKSVHVHAS